MSACDDINVHTGVTPCDPAGLHRELAQVLNRHGIDALLEVPDHVLAHMLIKQLDVYNETRLATRRLAMDFNQQPVTKTYRVGGCRPDVTIEQHTEHGGFPCGPELGDQNAKP